MRALFALMILGSVGYLCHLNIEVFNETKILRDRITAVEAENEGLRTTIVSIQKDLDPMGMQTHITLLQRCLAFEHRKVVKLRTIIDSFENQYELPRTQTVQ